MGISPIYAVTVEDDCKGYMYNARTDQLFTFDEFHTILMNGRWPFYVNTPVSYTHLILSLWQYAFSAAVINSAFAMFMLKA